MKPDGPHVLLVNPWIHDFAAYDFWAKPLGLLLIGGLLRRCGCRISYADCLDRHHRRAPKSDPWARNGRGPYLKTPIEKPSVFADVPRRFARYGIRPDWLRCDLADMEKPDLILLTSMMTYWYPGVAETVRVLRSAFPKVPLVLGGIYATLCTDHARRHMGADMVLSGREGGSLWEAVDELIGWRVRPEPNFEELETLPVLDLQRIVSYVPLMTSLGCPFSCPYCASKILAPRRVLRSTESVVEEIRHWHKDFSVADFVFYDDALLIDAENHAVPLLDGIIAQGLPLRFHTPNALHIRSITESLARKLFKAGFQTLRLGLETSRAQGARALDRKVSEEDFLFAVRALKRAGFSANQIGAYLLVGLPGQALEEIFEAIDTVRNAGITPIPAYYSPIPGTELWPEALRASRYELDNDPLLTNNAVLPCRSEPFSWDFATAIKTRASIGV
jgi:radical SAM superfamily enzyme YgiQ (UPF0313 family)